MDYDKVVGDDMNKIDGGIFDYIAHIHEVVVRLEDSNERIINQLASLKDDNAALKATLEDYRQEILDLKKQQEGVNNDGFTVRRKRKRSESSTLPAAVSTTSKSYTVNVEDTLITDNISALPADASANDRVIAIPKKASEVAIKQDGDNVYLINGSVGLDEIIPQLFENQLSYKFGAVPNQRKSEYRCALEYIKSRLTPEEVAVMKQKPPDGVQSPQQREVWSQQTMEMSAGIIRRIKEAVHVERGGNTRQSSCTLGAIGDFIKHKKLSISPPALAAAAAAVVVDLSNTTSNNSSGAADNSGDSSGGNGGGDNSTSSGGGGGVGGGGGGGGGGEGGGGDDDNGTTTQECNNVINSSGSN